MQAWEMNSYVRSSLHHDMHFESTRQISKRYNYSHPHAQHSRLPVFARFDDRPSYCYTEKGFLRRREQKSKRVGYHKILQKQELQVCKPYSLWDRTNKNIRNDTLYCMAIQRA